MGQYIDVIRQAAVIFPAIAVLFTVPYIAYNYHKYGSIFSMRILIVYSFILYMICVYCLVILPLPTGEAVEAMEGKEAHWYRYPIRYAWMFLIFNYVPFGIAELASYLLHAVESSRKLVYVLLLIGYGAFGFFLLFEFIRMAMHKQLFYERWSGTKIASTVVEK